MSEAKIYVKSITFNDGNTYEFDHSDIIVFTGANNSGKSQVLHDIMNYFSNKNIPRIVANNIILENTGDIEELKSKCVNRNGMYFLGRINIYHPDSLNEMWNNKDLHQIAPYFVNHLSTENRLQAASPIRAFDAVNDNPLNPIQELYINDKKEAELSTLFHQAFNTDIIINRGAGSMIPIHVGQTPVKESGEDRVSIAYLSKLKELPQIQNQGDGMRSFTGILLDTFTSNHSITLIDEPEAFLHPPQARLLGKMLVKNSPCSRQLFISTHSEDFLKGLLDTDNKNIKVIRINRVDNINHMNILNNKEITTFWNDSILRYSNILSGLFHSKVVICESDTDCRFYQAMLNTIHNEDEVGSDILFTHCGGKQRLKTVISALKSLNVKTITIADIDILNDCTTFREVTESTGIKWTDIETYWTIINGYVKDQRAQLETSEVKQQIEQILGKVTVQQLPVSIADNIKKVIKLSSAWSKVKETGKSFFTGESYKAFLSLYDICKKNGLLIVPVGELECFYKPDSNHGTKWVNNVLETVNLKNNPELNDARKFVEEILTI